MIEFPVINKAITLESSDVNKLTSEQRNDFFDLYNRIVYLPEYPFNKVRYFFNSETNFKTALQILDINNIDYSIYTRE